MSSRETNLNKSDKSVGAGRSVNRQTDHLHDGQTARKQTDKHIADRQIDRQTNS